MVSVEFNLSGKSALVAGDSRFWSKHVSIALAEAGADVAVAGRDSKKLDEAVAEVQRLGRKALAIPTDTTQSSQVEKMV
ncbi:MAG: SDR family NAD(P)-dependent oxidoreductase, partial [Dehalococcoidales bacterium]